MLLDYMNIMAYDMAGPWSEKAGHHAALHASPSVPGGASCSRAIDYMLKNGFPAWKIVMGVPAYAHSFPGATKVNDEFNKEKSKQIEYRDIPLSWRKHPQVDRTVVAAWHVDHENGFVSYDVPETIQLKAWYCKQNGLAGMFFWHGVGDTWGKLSLVSAAYASLL